MGKSKRRKLQEKAVHKQASSSRSSGLKSRTPPQPSSSSGVSKKPPKKAPAPTAQHTAPTIPFDANERILLVGEGDLSFATSLTTHHGCADLTATCFDDEATVMSKYPQAATHAATILAEGQTVLYGIDATKLDKHTALRKAGERYDRILFNFPHVGGKSTDVNRQVRYNQEMLVAFFRAAAPLLAPAGTIVVTLFDGEPYSLWNVRDLARHTGLEVQRSFAFQSAAYPGYAHARTLGNIEGGGGWKGESRAARTYVFQAKAKEKERAGWEHMSADRKRKLNPDAESSDSEG